jgi:hypothetical protein
MDPLDLIVTAIVTGATVGLHHTTAAAVKDAYRALKHDFLERYTGTDLLDAVKSVEGKPRSEARQAMLYEELVEAGAHRDTELVHAAQTFLIQADPRGAEAGKYNVEVSASDHSVAVGGDVQGDVSNVDNRRETHVEGDGNIVGEHGTTHVEKK